MKARFEDPHLLQPTYADIDKDGVCPKDPDLSRFLTSPPAVAAALQIQHGFESKYGKQECLDMVENYVTWGGDGGLTEAVMRKACNLHRGMFGPLLLVQEELSVWRKETKRNRKKKNGSTSGEA